MAAKAVMGFLLLRAKKGGSMRTRNAVQTKEFRRYSKNPVKLTALLYLREALLEERYEECAEFIQVAQEFGAEGFEIRDLLEDPRRLP